MSQSTCRLCNSQNTKLTASIDDEILSKFLDLVPSINLSSNSKLPSAVCQLCFSKAKISNDFIDKIQKVQKEVEKNFKKSPKKFSGSSSATEEALKKVQKVSGIVVKRVKNEIEHKEEDPGSVEVEMDYDDFDNDQDNKEESEYEIEVEDSGDDYIEEVAEDDDDDYKPSKSPRKAREVTQRAKPRNVRAAKDVSKL